MFPEIISRMFEQRLKPPVIRFLLMGFSLTMSFLTCLTSMLEHLTLIIDC